MSLDTQITIDRQIKSLKLTELGIQELVDSYECQSTVTDGNRRDL